MANFKKHLILRDCSHLFFNSLGNFIENLSFSFEITIILTETNFTPEINNKLLILKSRNLIREYYIVKDAKNSLRMFLGLKKLKKDLNKTNFDVSISRSSVSAFDRFIDENILSSNCLRAIYHDKTTYFLSDNLNLFLDDTEVTKILKKYFPKKKIFFKHKVFSKKKIIEVYKTKKEFYKLFPKIIDYIYIAIVKKFIKFFKYTLIERYVFPFLFTGKFYPISALSQATQITEGDDDLLFLTDPLEVDLHKYIFKNKKVKVIQVRNILEENSNFIIKNKKKNAVLSPLSGIGDRDFMPKKYLDLYLKPLQITLIESGASEIHLRVHPRETGKWQYQLCKYLNEKNIPCKITQPDRPICEIVCNYLGVAGFASGLLKDARASCDNIFVVGFEEISKLRYHNPTIVFGKGEGIGWIYSGNKYDKSIFDIKGNYSSTQNLLTEEINQEFLKKKTYL